MRSFKFSLKDVTFKKQFLRPCGFIRKKVRY